MNIADRDARVQEHVVKARSIVARQRQLIEKLRARGSDCEMAEKLLATFEAALVIFESNLAGSERPDDDAFVATPLTIPSRSAPSPQ